MTGELRKELRAYAIGMVLGTDLAFNFPTINTFKQLLAEKREMAGGRSPQSRQSSARKSNAAPLSAQDPSRGRASQAAPRASLLLKEMKSDGHIASFFDSFTAAEKLLVFKMVIKVADIGNVCKGKRCLLWSAFQLGGGQ